jgi:hypothetical protein
VYKAIEAVHVSGDMHRAIVEDMDRYVEPAPRIHNLLQSFSRAGKRFFLCTNSGFDYANRTLSYLLDVPYSPSGDGWRDYFDLVICSAQKPSFYHNKRPFREWDVATNSAAVRPVDLPRSSEIYVHGSAQELMRATGWHGKDILYLGDNLQSDLQEARRWHGWHTGDMSNSHDSILSHCSSIFLFASFLILLQDVSLTRWRVRCMRRTLLISASCMFYAHSQERYSSMCKSHLTVDTLLVPLILAGKRKHS